MKLESTYTKHYYIGSQRVSSALGTTFRLGYFPNQANNFFSDLTAMEDFRDVANAKVHTATAALSATYSAMNQSIALPNPAVEGSLDLNTLPFENNLYDAYFYHSDHLGSSNYISNNTGIVSQHTEYLPFGETFVDEHLNSHNTPFKFNAKELDDETGNYYYGARYYNPKWSTWLSVDPLAEIMPDMSVYAYGFNNPIRFTDPTGMIPSDSGDGGGGPLTKAQKEYMDDYNANLKPMEFPMTVEQASEADVLEGVTVTGKQESSSVNTNDISVGLTLGGVAATVFEDIIKYNFPNRNPFLIGTFSDSNLTTFNTIQNSTLAQNGIRTIYVYNKEALKAIENLKKIVTWGGYGLALADGSITIYNMFNGEISFQRGMYSLVRTGAMTKGSIGILVGGIMYMVEHLYDEHQNNPNTPSRLIQNEVQNSFNFDMRSILNGFTPGGGRY